MSDTVSMIICISSAVLYYIAAGLNFSSKTGKAAIVVWAAAVIANASIVVNNWLVNGYVPFVSMYQVITFLSFIFAPIFIYIKYMHRGGWMAKYFCLSSAVCMTGVCFMSGGGVWHFPPALQSIWFVPHILAYMIAYSLSAVAFIITIVSFFKKDQKAKLDNGAYNLVCTAFPFMTMGMFFGAIWANAVWGNFWSFDAKENWSLVTWMMFMIYLHFRRHAALKKYSKLFIILGFIGVVITMLFVNVMGGSSQHAYSV